MTVDINKLWVYRIIPIQNLEFIIRDGLFSKSSAKDDKGFVTIGSQEIISQRSTRLVKCYPETVVNDYVPFYFSVRTPMLYNIITGRGVLTRQQEDIIYICCKLCDLATDDFKWCFTDGNAAKSFTKFSNNIKNIDNLDWRSIRTTDFRDENDDGDEDRIRKKHSEFLVKDCVPVNLIKGIAVLNSEKMIQVKQILEKVGVDIEVKIKTNFYFL